MHTRMAAHKRRLRTTLSNGFAKRVSQAHLLRDRHSSAVLGPFRRAHYRMTFLHQWTHWISCHPWTASVWSLEEVSDEATSPPICWFLMVRCGSIHSLVTKKMDEWVDNSDVPHWLHRVLWIFALERVVWNWMTFVSSVDNSSENRVHLAGWQSDEEWHEIMLVIAFKAEFGLWTTVGRRSESEG